jgi:hypothetical protein
MPLDKDLLAAATAAGQRLSSAEHDTRVARADYHHAVRRLHLAGAPLREVAQALGVSHQRIQQIVKASGGTWWTRVWRTRKTSPDMTCSFCLLPSDRVAKLIAGPEVFICDACVALAEQVVKTRRAKGAGYQRMEPAGSARTRCSFCGRKTSDTRAVVGAAEGTVCNECLALCRRILDDRSANGAAVGDGPAAGNPS